MTASAGPTRQTRQHGLAIACLLIGLIGAGCGDSSSPSLDGDAGAEADALRRRADTRAPSVSIVAPSSGAAVAGTFSVVAEASDNVGVVGVQFKLDGANLGVEDRFSPYSIAVDSAVLADGSHTLTAVARDAAGNRTSSAAVTVTVNNAGSAASIRLGEPNVLAADDGGNGNLLVAQQAVLTGPGIVRSLSFYVTSAAGKLRLGVYDATGPGGGPGAKRAETAEFSPAAGWNSVNVLAPVQLPVGTYWLAYFSSDNALAFKKELTGAAKYYSLPYGALPASFSASPTAETVHWSLYATLSAADGTTDTTPPMISIAAPASGATVSGSAVTISANASDNVGVVGVQFKVDGNNLGAEDTSAPYSAIMDSAALANGLHSLTAVARDAAGNVSTSASISVTVSSGLADTTAPSVPADLTAVAVSGSQINLSWTASTDNVAVAGYRVERCMGGTCTNFAQVAAPSGNVFNDTGLAANTPYRYQVRAVDGSGNLSGYSGIASGTTQSQTGYPDATNTGVPAGTALTVVNGDVSLNTAGMIYENRDVRGCIAVNAPNVIIRKSKVSCRGSAISSNSTNLLVEDATIDCQAARGASAIGAQNYTARRINAFNCENVLWAENNVTIEDSYLHDPIPYDPATDPHTDTIQLPESATNITIRHNRIYGSYIDRNNFGNSAVTTGGLISNFLLEDNLVAGGGYTVRCEGVGKNINYRVINNRFSTLFVATVGGFGPVNQCAENANQYSGNVFHESGLPISGQ